MYHSGHSSRPAFPARSRGCNDGSPCPRWLWRRLGNKDRAHPHALEIVELESFRDRPRKELSGDSSSERSSRGRSQASPSLLVWTNRSPE